jgi:hypothetical protein
MGITIGQPDWRLGKQLANYMLRAGAELASREIDPAKLLDG